MYLFYSETTLSIVTSISKMNEPERKPSQTKSQTDVAAFSRYKWNTFICMYVGYLMAIFSRKCFSFVLPAIIAEGHISKGELGT